jgi:hypothetical protein
MDKKLPGTGERNGGTSLNKSANIFVTNPANTTCEKYVDLWYVGSLFPLTPAEHLLTATLFTKRKAARPNTYCLYSRDLP